MNFNSPKEAGEFLQKKIGNKRKENFYIMLLTAKNKLIKGTIMQTGTIDQCAVYPREIVRYAIIHDAASIILGHNHPSGDITPSTHDTRLTHTIRDAAKIFDIEIHDHIIVAKKSDKFHSMAESRNL
jgi:DNA repair protein RadC